jgi:hypothetical protein
MTAVMAIIHAILLVQVGVLSYVVYYLTSFIIIKNGRLLYVLSYDSNPVGIFRDHTAAMTYAERQVLRERPDDVVKWERRGLYVRRLERWLYTGYHFETFPLYPVRVRKDNGHD